jgi:DNA-binding Xre family transcriptional regulator
MNTGKSIQIALVNKGWQKKDLAEKLGVTRSTVSNLVKSSTCTGQALDNLCEVFEMKASEFIALGESNE